MTHLRGMVGVRMLRTPRPPRIRVLAYAVAPDFPREGLLPFISQHLCFNLSPCRSSSATPHFF